MLISSGKFNKYALCSAVFCTAVFLFLEKGVSVSAILFSLITAVLSVVLLFVRGKHMDVCKHSSLVFACAFLGILCSVVSNFIYCYPSENFLREYEDRECSMLAEIYGVCSSGENYGIYDAYLISADDKILTSSFTATPKIRISTFGNGILSVGDVVSFTGIPGKPEEISKSGFAESRYLASQRIFINCSVKSEFKLLAEKSPGFWQRLRSKMSSTITRYVGKDKITDETLIARCMLLGDKNGISSHIKEIFRISGISHILSVSGLHLSILFYFISYTMRFLKQRKRRRFPTAEIVSCFIALVYMILADFSPSVMRAGFMLMGANLFEFYFYYVKKYKELSPERIFEYNSFNSLSSLFISAGIISVFSPYSLFDIGFQLSFVSTLGIILVMSFVNDYIRKIRSSFIRFIVTCIVVTVSATSFTLPICALNFGSISLMSVISNILVTPIVTPLLVLLLILVLISLLPAVFPVTAACTLLGTVCEFLCSLCIGVAEMNSGFVFSSVPASDSIVTVIAFSALILPCVVFAIFRFDKACAFCCAGIVLLSVICNTAYFADAVHQHCRTKLYTVQYDNGNYACVHVRNTRVIFDSAEELSSFEDMKELITEQNYDINVVYVPAFSEDSDAVKLLYNIEQFTRFEEIDTVLLPKDIFYGTKQSQNEPYNELVKRLSEKGTEIELYDKSFSIGRTEFKTVFAGEYSVYCFDKYVLMFTERYNEETAEVLCNSTDDITKTCILFADRIENKHNPVAEKGIKLNVYTSSVSKVENSDKLSPKEIFFFD